MKQIDQEIVSFWDRYPHGKFTAKMVTDAIGRSDHRAVEYVLQALVDDGVLEHHMNAKLVYYQRKRS